MTLEDLDKIDALKATPFPFEGKRDFRDWKDEDYNRWAGGVFQRMPAAGAAAVRGPILAPMLRECKWIGGADKLSAAVKALLALGLDVTIIPPGIRPPPGVCTRWFTAAFVLT